MSQLENEATPKIINELQKTAIRVIRQKQKPCHVSMDDSSSGCPIKSDTDTSKRISLTATATNRRQSIPMLINSSTSSSFNSCNQSLMIEDKSHKKFVKIPQCLS